MIVLDTHVFVWLLEATPRLGRNARRQIEIAAKRREAAISTISYSEIASLLAAGRMRVQRGVEGMRAEAQAGGFLEVAVDAEIAMLAGRLEGLHGDPADRLIFATALQRSATLVTADEKLLTAPSGPKRLDAQR